MNNIIINIINIYFKGRFYTEASLSIHNLCIYYTLTGNEKYSIIVSKNIPGGKHGKHPQQKRLYMRYGWSYLPRQPHTRRCRRLR